MRGKAVGIREGVEWREMTGDAIQSRRKGWGNLGGTPKLPHKLGPKLNGYTKSYSKARMILRWNYPVLFL